MPTEKILVIDDSSDVRDYVAEYVVRPSGYDPLTAANGVAGLELIRTAQPSLVVADIKMPGLDGLQLTDTLRREGHDLPVILITAAGSEEMAREALRGGAADYIIKPLHSEIGRA